MASSYPQGSAAMSAAPRSRPAAVRPVVLADPHRHIVFPNAIRDVRVAKGYSKLLSFAARLPDIPYIRLSKIERGEVVARAQELVRIAAALAVAPAALLIDIAAPDFDLAAWFAPFAERAAVDDPHEARLAILLAAAVRRARAADPGLSATVVNDVFGIAPVILSRIENAHKGLSRWSPDIVAAIGRLLGDRDQPALRRWLQDQYAQGALNRFLRDIVGAEDREQRMRQRIAALRTELDRIGAEGDRRAASQRTAADPDGAARRIALFGVAASDGTILLTPAGGMIPAPGDSGARAFGVRISRATLGPGLPAGTIVVVDPDRHPHGGGLALVRDGDGHRLVAVSAGRTGALVGYSLYPEREIAIDALETGAAAAVTAAVFA